MPTITSPKIDSRDSGLSDEEAFLQSEASVRLEGIDPNESPIYVELKGRVLAGEISSEEAVQRMANYYRDRQTAAA